MRRNSRTFRQHLEEYVFSTIYCSRRKVLDLGAKDGYGAHIISRFSSHITLADCHGKFLGYANKYNRFLCPAEFVLIDFNKAFPEGKWDTIVAFQIIEHVDDPDNFVKEIAKHLSEKGILVFSVPHMMPSPDHKTLFNEKSIKELVSKHLSIKEFYIQDSYGISKEPMKNKIYVGVATK